MAYALSDDAAALVESLPDAAQKVRDSLRVTRGTSEGPIQKVQRAAEKLEAVAEESGSAAPATSKGVTRVQVERQRFDLKDYLQFGTLGMALLTGGASLAIHTVAGNLLTPWLTGRASRLSPLVIFVDVLAWGWLLGLVAGASGGCCWARR